MMCSKNLFGFGAGHLDTTPTGYTRPPSCYESHKPLPILGGELHGGSARNHVAGCDLYVSLEASGMRYPAFAPGKAIPRCVSFPIRNMHTPDDVSAFFSLVDTVEEALRGGQKVHVGCIGGHGRTGLVLAAVVAAAGVSDDAIAYVREHYCTSAVESWSQVAFLMDHFLCPLAKPRYSFAGTKVDKP